MILTLTAPREGQTVRDAARRELLVSASMLRRLKAADAIHVNGERAFADRRLAAGDTLTLDLAAAEPPCGLVPEQGPVDVLWEIEGLLAVNKPCGTIVHPTRSRYTGTLSNFVAGRLPEHVCHAVNRLDRDTSGVVLFAENAYWKDLASRALDESGEKAYLALVFGMPAPLSGTVDAPIARESPNALRRIVSDGGQRAVTHYETLASYGEYSLVLLRLDTGRTHQIRVHMQHIGCPVLGDGLYRTEASAALSARLGLAAQALHAQTLAFTLPFGRGPVTVTAPVKRPDFLAAARSLGFAEPL